MRRLDGRIALITGGGNGIGRAIALRLAEEGANIALMDIDPAGMGKTAAAVTALGRRVECESGNVGDPAAVARAVAALEKRLGPADVLVNNAGIVRLATVLETANEDWRESMRINAEGTLNLCKAVVPGMVARKRGSVVNLSSWLGKAGRPFFGMYSATKAAVIMLTQALALEIAATGVRVNAVCPGLIEGTPMRAGVEEQSKNLGMAPTKDRIASIPMKRTGTPEDVARVVAFLASDEAGYMTGQAINISGGMWQH
ncbi:MAG: SDR family oxidoreductase [Alphaproteobacteria bacterium]|nr:SDR family oxidoreductase [Alphaproteobacteria bacterium]